MENPQCRESVFFLGGLKQNPRPKPTKATKPQAPSCKESVELSLDMEPHEGRENHWRFWDLEWKVEFTIWLWHVMTNIAMENHHFNR